MRLTKFDFALLSVVQFFLIIGNSFAAADDFNKYGFRIYNVTCGF